MAASADDQEPQPPNNAPFPVTPPPDPAESPWRTRAAHEVYRNPWLSVTEYAVIRPDGAPGIYGVVNPGDNASIVALDDAGRIALVGEFCYPLQRPKWSLPSGKVEDGEAPLLAAQREFAEETGFEADEWTLLGAYPLSPGISTQVSYIYLARGLRAGLPRPEGTEQIQTRWMPLRAALDAALDNTLSDAITVIGVWRLWFQLHPSMIER